MNNTTLAELEQFYNEIINRDGELPYGFEDLTDVEKQDLERSLSFAMFRLRKSYTQLGRAFCAEIPVIKVPNVPQGLWKYQRITETTRFERFCLYFIRKKFSCDEIENTTTAYKLFRGKLFVVGFYINPPKHFNCRCTVDPVKD